MALDHGPRGPQEGRPGVGYPDVVLDGGWKAAEAAADATLVGAAALAWSLRRKGGVR